MKSTAQSHNSTRPLQRRHRSQIHPDQFCGAAADVHDQKLFGFSTYQWRTGNDRQTRFFLWLDNLQLQSGLPLDLPDKLTRVLCTPAGLRSDQPHTFNFVPLQFLLADAHSLNRAPHGPTRKTSGTFQPGTELDRLAKAVHHMNLTALRLGNQHAATVCAQIKRCIKRAGIGRFRRGAFNRYRERARTFGTLGRHIYALHFVLPSA
mmetsp:Transcript_27106/g.49446  ORF Transcript_27106/g.49446 Transcript_27106/m.49446 type:complete len:206 (-) Transcript_27106:10-627(-)